MNLVGDAMTDTLHLNGKHAKSVQNLKSGRIAAIFQTKETIVVFVMDGIVRNTRRLLVQGTYLIGCVSLAKISIKNNMLINVNFQFQNLQFNIDV